MSKRPKDSRSLEPTGKSQGVVLKQPHGKYTRSKGSRAREPTEEPLDVLPWPRLRTCSHPKGSPVVVPTEGHPGDLPRQPLCTYKYRRKGCCRGPTPGCLRYHHAYIPRAPVFSRPPKHFKMSFPAGRVTRTSVPRAAAIFPCPLEIVEVPSHGSRRAGSFGQVTPILARPCEDAQVHFFVSIAA